jgi:hypothetical protein
MFSVELRRKSDEVALIMLGPIGCSETSVRNYRYTLRNIAGDCGSQGDTITMATLKLYSSELFSFQKGTRQAPYISMQSVSLQRIYRLTSYKNRICLKVTCTV